MLNLQLSVVVDLESLVQSVEFHLLDEREESAFLALYYDKQVDQLPIYLNSWSW